MSSNIWESLLKESAKRVHLPEGTVLFLGNSGCGKSDLVRRICSDLANSDAVDQDKIPDIIAYDSFVASDVEEVH